MRYLAILFGLLQSLATTVNAQKPVVDSSIFDKWPVINDYAISNDGKYSSYIVVDKKTGAYKLNTLSNSSNWKIEIINNRPIRFAFSGNSCQSFFLNSKDSLGIVELGRPIIRYVSGVKSFSLSEKGNWIAYLINNDKKELCLKDLIGKKETFFPNVTNYEFSKNGEVLLLEHLSEKNHQQVESLDWVDLPTGDVSKVWEGFHMDSYVFDNSCQQLAFRVNEPFENNVNFSIYFFRKGMKKSTRLINDKELGYGFRIGNGTLQFSRKADRLLFRMEKVNEHNEEDTVAYSGVIIWHYKDSYLRSERISPQDSATVFFSIINLGTKKLTRLNEQGQRLVISRDFQDYFLLYELGQPDDFYERSKRPSLYIVNSDNGEKNILSGKKRLSQYSLSPDDQFVIWFDPDSLSYFSYHINTRHIKNISNKIPFPLYDEENVKVGRPNWSNFEIAGWDSSNHSVCLYDKFDIWHIDLQAKSSPVNLTNGFGRRNSIVFAFLSLNPSGIVNYIQSNGQLLLTGFNIQTKFNGFWKLIPNVLADPIKESMDPCAYYVSRTGRTGPFAPYARGSTPIKAKSANVYLVQKMTASDFPNLYLTSDFKFFKPISDIHPEKAYNWLKSELITFDIPGGITSQGILYKPENFESTRKYPLIFTYYEKKSDEFQLFIRPEFSSAQINIPFYVSNGYLVFVPDIYYKQGYNGQSVVDVLVSAAKLLSSYSWVDSTKLGLQGHSFGGWETNFLVTHTHLFAAACEASGVSDQVSAYDQLNFSGGDRQRFYETLSQGSNYGIGVTPWTHPDLYIGNSPIFFADKAVTPLLMMHGDIDAAVPFSQALEMFLALRRAGKKVWLLEYTKADHVLSGHDRIDFTIRMKQFFDYYLKGVSPPKWMTSDLPLTKRDLEAGLELDSSGRLP